MFCRQLRPNRHASQAAPDGTAGMTKPTFAAGETILDNP
jgi:hypothetical protein